MNIFKYSLYCSPGDSDYTVPPGTVPLTVQLQDNVPVLWMKQPESNAPGHRLRVRTVYTGVDVLADDLYTYLGTFQLNGLVYHSFWRYV